MKLAQSRLQHLPYFEALATMDDGTPDWLETSAGLVVLRLVDGWICEGSSILSRDSWSLRAVRDAIKRVPMGTPTRSILSSIVDTMEAQKEVGMATLAPRLMAFGRALQYNGRWALAADVHESIITYAHPVEDSDVVIDANIQLGACLRTLARWSEATAAYARASQIATMSGDVVRALLSRVAEAALAIDRGNLPFAEAVLDQTIAEATGPQLAEPRAMALHTRARVAYQRKNYEAAVGFAYAAYQELKLQSARDRALGDLATMFSELGVRSAARDAYLILAATAQEQYSRWTALINLMELASLENIEPVFEQYRRELAAAELPTMLSAYYFYYVGKGYRMFDRPDAARASFERAVEISQSHQLNQILFDSEQALRELESGTALQEATPFEEPSGEVQLVASAIRDLRETAGVAG
jgi:tetratricopeptide (TPR) repeat protein